MEQDTLKVLQTFARDLNNNFDIMIDDVIHAEDTADLWICMFTAYCLGLGYTLEEYNNAMREAFAGIDDQTVFIKTLFGEYND